MLVGKNPIVRSLLLLPVWIVAAAGGFAAGAEPVKVSDAELRAKMEEAWQASWQLYFDERTQLFYDYASRDGVRSELPTPAEIARQYPNRNGWGTGMEDCAINGGVIMSMICDRFAATGDKAMREAAAKVFAGLVLLGTVSPSEGFLARGVCPTDRRSHYCESSRDQYTWYAYGLWRYSLSALAGPAEKATMAKVIAAICRRLERNVVAANGYHIGREDGTMDGLVDTMWENEAHEMARLPMIYAIGAELTGDGHWRDLADRYTPEAIEKSKPESTKIAYALLQQQVSLETLYELAKSADVKRQWLDVMQVVADRAAVFLPRCRDYRTPDIEASRFDWRAWPKRTSRGYLLPTKPEDWGREKHTQRDPAEAALVLLLVPQGAPSAEQLQWMRQIIAQPDSTKMLSYGLHYTQAAYWRAVRQGLFKLPNAAGQ